MCGKNNMAEQKPKTSLRQDIDENLKRVFNEALDAEVPDRFKLLLAELKAKDSAAKSPKP